MTGPGDGGEVDPLLHHLVERGELPELLHGGDDLLGSEVDFEMTPLHEKFVFRNPNQTDACGCGESVTIVPSVAD